MEESHKQLIKYNLILTITLLMALIFTASHGELFINLFKYYVDPVFLMVYLLLGYYISKLTINFVINSKRINALLVMFFYYYSACAVFNDGYSGGWSHTTTIIDKITILVINMLLSTFLIIIPLFFIIIALIHYGILTLLVKRYCSN